MDRRLQLHQTLSDLTGFEAVYFQPPQNLAMQYPCIRYHLDNSKKEHANNHPYSRASRYELTVISKQPSADLIEQVDMLPKCTFDRSFKAENLYHHVFTIFL